MSGSAEFVAHAAHELRTPLAITQALLDVARSDPERAGEIVERLRAVNARAIELTEALLLLSRADRGSFPRERVDLSLIAEEAAETLLPLAERHGVAIHTYADFSPIDGSAALLLPMTMNLVHNAVVHNLPSGGSVWVRAASAVLTVENTGERLAEVLTLTEPFRRGRDEGAGHGLGLAIVKSIVEAHDGTLRLAARPGGGLIASAHFIEKSK